MTIEQSGLVRAVAKIEGKHRGMKSNREWLPFVVRLYFYAGQETVRLVHTVVYDGDESIVAACLIKLLLVVAFMSVDPGDLKCEGEIHASFP